MSEWRFSLSVIKAIECAMRLFYGKLLENVEPPEWMDFDFFHRIEASPIRRLKRKGSWELKRDVDFFHYGRRILTVSLVGLKIDGGCSEDSDNSSCWEVERVVYNCQFIPGFTGHWRVLAYIDGPLTRPTNRPLDLNY